MDRQSLLLQSFAAAVLIPFAVNTLFAVAIGIRDFFVWTRPQRLIQPPFIQSESLQRSDFTITHHCGSSSQVQVAWEAKCLLLRLFRNMSKKLKIGKKATVPPSVIDQMKAAGADFQKMSAPEWMGRDIVTCTSGDDATKAYLDWMDGITDDPGVQAVWGPMDGVIPPDGQVGALLREANWMIHHCAALRMPNFAGGAIPAIGGPGAVMPPAMLPIRVQHASVAGSYLINLLQNPPATYPAINLLGTGTYICTVQYIWSEVVVVIQVTKG
jgi:hypothetical protein